jgi:hypothetical protein
MAYLYFSRIAYNIEGAILMPVGSRVSIYACVKKCTSATKVSWKNSQNSTVTEDDLLLQIINPINPQDTKDICLFIKESFTKRETFKGNSLMHKVRLYLNTPA